MTEERCGYCGSDMVSMVHSPTCAMISKECPSCSRFAAKMKDREGLMRRIHRHDNQAMYLSFEEEDSDAKEFYGIIADAILRWMEE